MGKKVLFIYNPKSGKAQIKTKLADILDVFAAAEYDVTVAPTRKHGDATEFARERAGEFDLIVCSGGDGTLNEVVTGVISGGWKTDIGYIPAGSTNDFGGSLELPKNMVKAAEMIVDGRTFSCDVGSFNGKSFVYIAAFGLFTDVSYETDQDMKNVLGHAAYILEGMKRLSSFSSIPMKVTYDDNVIEDSFIFGMVTNSLSVGGFKNITGKDVKLDDGMFEVTLIRMPKNPVEFNNIVVSLLNREVTTDSVVFFHASELKIEFEEPVSWTLDGENGGSHTNLCIKNLHQAMNIRVASNCSVLGDLN